jgi:hypothetical protein
MPDCRTLASRVDSLRRTLPISGHPRSMLLAELRLRKAAGRATPKVKIIDVFDLGDDGGVMCRFLLDDGDARSFVAPLSQVALVRRHPLAQAIAACRRPSRVGAV